MHARHEETIDFRRLHREGSCLEKLEEHEQNVDIVPGTAQRKTERKKERKKGRNNEKKEERKGQVGKREEEKKEREKRRTN